MKLLSQLIRQLIDYLKEHGDVPVEFEDRITGWNYKPRGNKVIHVEDLKQGKKAVIDIEYDRTEQYTLKN